MIPTSDSSIIVYESEKGCSYALLECFESRHVCHPLYMEKVIVRLLSFDNCIIRQICDYYKSQDVESQSYLNFTVLLKA